MEIIHTNTFKKAYKKLQKNQLIDANIAINAIIENPQIGIQKKGDLVYVRVHKFKMLHQLTLIAYTIDDNKITLTFISLASHANFYKNLKR